MKTIVSHGAYYFLYILVITITRIEFRIIKNKLLNETLMVSILQMDLSVVMFTN